jgi:hypothetical protein
VSVAEIVVVTPVTRVEGSVPVGGEADNIARRLVREYSATCVITRHMKTAIPNNEKYITNVGLLNNSSRSSRDRVGSGTIPKTAIRTAPPAMRRVPSIIHGENTSPRRKRAKNAFQRRDTAPRGASITTGREAI